MLIPAPNLKSEDRTGVCLWELGEGLSCCTNFEHLKFVLFSAFFIVKKLKPQNLQELCQSDSLISSN